MYNLLKKGNTCNNKVFKEDYMKRNMNLKKVGETNINDKIISYAVVGAIIVAIIIISLLLYSQQINQDVQDETMTLEQMTNMIGDTSNNVEETESASTEIGKTVEESQAENQVEEESTQSQTTQNTSSNQTVESNANATENTTQNTTQNVTSNQETTNNKEETSIPKEKITYNNTATQKLIQDIDDIAKRNKDLWGENSEKRYKIQISSSLVGGSYMCPYRKEQVEGIVLNSYPVTFLVYAVTYQKTGYQDEVRYYISVTNY